MAPSGCFLFFVLLYMQTDISWQQSCDTGSYIVKTHSWSKGYVAKLYLDQSWLSSATSEWKLALGFTEEVQEYKVWDAEILNPATMNNYVYNVTAVEIMNKCWNPTMHPCQYLELSFLVRFDCVPGNEGATYDINYISQSASYKDGTTGTNFFCNPTTGEPPAISASSTTTM